MKLIWAFILICGSQIHAYQVQTKVYNTINEFVDGPVASRQIANEQNEKAEESMFVYHSPDSKLKNKTYAVDLNSWTNFKKQGSSRLDLFLKLYYANIKSVSNTGQRHVGCFIGDAEKVANDFFKAALPIDNVEKLYVTVSEDRKMLGLEFDFRAAGSKKPLVTAHFRLPHCIQGTKTPLIEMNQIVTAQLGMPEIVRSIASEATIRLPAAQEGENGFSMYDQLNKIDEAAESTKKLPRFQLRADYDQMHPQAESRPWKGMDISTEEGAQKFAQVMIDYFWDSLAQDSKNPNNNLIATNIDKAKTQWCHMPWLNVGDSGRELIHGLTKERDLEKSEIYPEVADTKDKEGSDWGIGFYNDIACKAAGQIFGSHPNNVLETPDFTKSKFPEGSVSVKVLFTTAKLDALKGSFAWNANVSLPKSTTRRIREVRMIQIDVAVKDSSLKGVRKEADGWMMTTFYFDANYTAPSRHKFTGVLSSLLKMRPIGVQTGFDPSTSLIFVGSKTNSANNAYYGINPRLMNGPADNPKASCLACHGAAGTSAKMVPGVKDYAEYMKVKAKSLDFSQQLALAKRNHETRTGQKTAKGW